MNNIFHEYLDDFVIIYIDDILVYSKTAKEHAEHLKKVFQKLRSNKLYAKGDKCDWGKLRIKFLGHELTQGGVMVDDQKIKGDFRMGETQNDQGAKVVPWIGELLSQVRAGLRKIAKPLSDLLKKSVLEIWDGGGRMC